MRRTTEESIKKMIDILSDTDKYLSATAIAEKMNTGKASIYRYMKLAREKGIGIFPVPNKGGYVLAEYAKKSDDVHFLRTIIGKHAGSCVALAAARKFIINRWKDTSEHKLLMDVIRPLSMDLSLLRHNDKLLEDKSASLE